MLGATADNERLVINDVIWAKEYVSYKGQERRDYSNEDKAHYWRKASIHVLLR